MSRFIDDAPFHGAPRIGPPTTLNMLLTELRVSFSPLDEQRTAVEHWLKTNTPGDRLAADLAAEHFAASG